MELIIVNFIATFFIVYINRKIVFREGIRKVLEYLIYSNKEEYEEFMKDITELRNETEKNDSTTIMRHFNRLMP